jgi:hypothetical protein
MEEWDKTPLEGGTGERILRPVKVLHFLIRK